MRGQAHSVHVLLITRRLLERWLARRRGEVVPPVVGAAQDAAEQQQASGVVRAGRAGRAAGLAVDRDRTGRGAAFESIGAFADRAAPRVGHSTRKDTGRGHRRSVERPPARACAGASTLGAPTWHGLCLTYGGAVERIRQHIRPERSKKGARDGLPADVVTGGSPG